MSIIDEIISDEFTLLKKIIEQDKAHINRKEKVNENYRYKTVSPYKDNIVKLISSQNFINASWIHMPYPFYFIAAQGPLPHTIEDFWTMCYENKVSVILMLCNLKEGEKEKCSDYWNVKDLKNFEITILEEKKENELTIRSLQVINKENKEELRKITQIHFTEWNDHTSLTTDYLNIMINIINLLDELKEKRNIVIHCSAGVGRTGTFICLYNLYHEIITQIYSKVKLKEITFCIFNLVRKIKEMRYFSVENEFQYTFLYLFANCILKKYNIKK